MKIALIHNQYKLRGGMERYLFDIITGFIEQGDTVDVHVCHVAKEAPRIDACQVVDQGHWALPRRIKKYCFYRKLNKHFIPEQYDLSLTLTKTTCQDIIACGGVHAENAIAMSRNFYKKMHDRIEKNFERKAFNASRVIVAHSKLLKEEIVRHYDIDPQKIHVLYPPISTYHFNSLVRNHRAELQAQFKINPNKLTLLFPSTGHTRKGLLELLAAFRQLPAEFELLIAGNKPNKQEISGNVRYLGYVKEMAKLYAACDFTILPSKYEPFGLVIAESLQCGTPVVVSKNAGVCELLSPEEGVILNAITPAEILATIKSLPQRTFTVAPNYALRHGLTIENHIKTLKKIGLEKLV